MSQFTRRGFVGSILGAAAAKAFGAQQGTRGRSNAAGQRTDQNHGPQVRHHRAQPGGAHCHRSGHFRIW